MALISSRLLALRGSPVLLKLPPYLSALCILVGVAWLLVLPLNDYSRQTYVSENAILPGQVHTYFGGSEHNFFRAYRQEVHTLAERSEDDRVQGLEHIFRENGLKFAKQPYSFSVAGEKIEGTNVYGLLQGPRADATEAMVLMAAWRNFDGVINYSGVALALTLARYFKRWSIWSKDVIILIPADSTYGPEAWVSAYHSVSSAVSSSANVSALPIKGGALQAAVALDYPAGPWGHRFDKLDVLYDGINGALPNLDLLNTAVSIASGQMGIGCSIHGLAAHSDSYADRLHTIARGIMTQGAGHATGPHSAFMPYHIDAITLKTTGDGWYDEMSLGRTTESLFRSINNIMEHLHQSFFFYILMNANRFVSIGTYLPAAMLVAGSFATTAMALWVQSGRASGKAFGPDEKGGSASKPEMVLVKEGGDVALVPIEAMNVTERKMFLPAICVLGVHLLGFMPLYALNYLSKSNLPHALMVITSASLLLPPSCSAILTRALNASPQQLQLMQSFSLLLLGATLSTLATLNFSLALVIGLAASPLNFIRPIPNNLNPVGLAATVPVAVLHTAACPPVLLYAANFYWAKEIEWTLTEIAKGWGAQGVWTSYFVWGIWWPTWVVGGIVVWSQIANARK